jgi:hypothetical protein
MAIQADHYIIRIAPPEPAPDRRSSPIVEILAANNYVLGSASVDFAVDDEVSDALMFFSIKKHEQISGRQVDLNRTRTHNFSGRTVTGKLVAVFYGRPTSQGEEATSPTEEQQHISDPTTEAVRCPNCTAVIGLRDDIRKRFPAVGNFFKSGTLSLNMVCPSCKSSITLNV